MDAAFPATHPRHRWWRLLLGLVCGTLFVVLISRSISLRAVLSTMADAAWLPLLVGLAAYALDFVLRAIRFWLLLDGPTRRVPLAGSISPFIASFGISDILPLRIGDVFRILWFNRRFKLPVGTLLGAMLLERMFDLVSLVLLAAVAFAMADITLDGTLLAIANAVVAVTVLSSLIILAAPALVGKVAEYFNRRNGNLPQRIGTTLEAMAKAIADFGSWRRLTGMLLFSLLIWLLESVVLIGAWISLGGTSENGSAPFLAFTVSTLGTLVPALPGHFGSYEYFGMIAFDAAGIDRTMGAATILLSHLILWVPTAAFGVAWLMASGRKDVMRLRAAA